MQINETQIAQIRRAQRDNESGFLCTKCLKNIYKKSEKKTFRVYPGNRTFIFTEKNRIT